MVVDHICRSKTSDSMHDKQERVTATSISQMLNNVGQGVSIPLKELRRHDRTLLGEEQ